MCINCQKWCQNVDTLQNIPSYFFLILLFPYRYKVAKVINSSKYHHLFLVWMQLLMLEFCVENLSHFISCEHSRVCRCKVEKFKIIFTQTSQGIGILIELRSCIEDDKVRRSVVTECLGISLKQRRFYIVVKMSLGTWCYEFRFLYDSERTMKNGYLHLTLIKAILIFDFST